MFTKLIVFVSNLISGLVSIISDKLYDLRATRASRVFRRFANDFVTFDLLESIPVLAMNSIADAMHQLREQLENVSPNRIWSSRFTYDDFYGKTTNPCHIDEYSRHAYRDMKGSSFALNIDFNKNNFLESFLKEWDIDPRFKGLVVRQLTNAISTYYAGKYSNHDLYAISVSELENSDRLCILIWYPDDTESPE